MDKELDGHTQKGYSEWLIVQVENSEEWYPQGSVMGLTQTQTVGSNAHSQFADDNNLSSTVKLLEGTDAIQSYLDRLETLHNSMKTW